MHILRKLFSKKKSTKIEEGAKDVVGLGLVSSGAVLAKNANKNGEISGRVNLYHSINKKHVKSALKNGLDGKYSKENSESLSNLVTRGKASKDPRDIIYLAKDKDLARETSLSRFNKSKGEKPSTYLKLSIPYDELKKKRTYGNPEFDNFRSFEEYRKRGGIKSAAEFKDLSGEKSSRTVLIDGKLGAERIKGSKKYQKNSLKEIGKYIKKNPKRFAKGAGKVLVGAGSIMAGAKLLKGNNSDSEVSNNLIGATAGTLVGSKIIRDSNKKFKKLDKYIKDNVDTLSKPLKEKESKIVREAVTKDPNNYLGVKNIDKLLELKNKASKDIEKESSAIKSFQRRAGKLSKQIKQSGKIKGVASGIGVYGAYSGYKRYARKKKINSSK